MANIVELIKQAATEAVGASMPTAIFYGTVTSTEPLEINVEQKINLTKDFLILTNAVKDHDVEMTVNHYTETVSLNANHTHEAESSGGISVKAKLDPKQPGTEIVTEVENTASTSISEAEIDLSHKHAYSGRKIFRVHNGLKKGETVVLLRIQGGQRYIVIDRV